MSLESPGPQTDSVFDVACPNRWWLTAWSALHKPSHDKRADELRDGYVIPQIDQW